MQSSAKNPTPFKGGSVKIRKLRVDGWVQHYHVNPDVRSKEGFVAIPFRLREIKWFASSKNASALQRASNFLNNYAVLYIMRAIRELAVNYECKNDDGSWPIIKDDRALLIIPIKLANILKKGVFFRDAKGILHSLLSYIDLAQQKKDFHQEKINKQLVSGLDKGFRKFGDNNHRKIRIFMSEEFFNYFEDDLGYDTRYLEVM
jgi:hypothetical protein